MLGADERGKAVVSREVIESSEFYCDDRALACKMGALGAVGLPFSAGPVNRSIFLADQSR